MELSLHVLVADSEPSVCQFYQQSLCARGHQVSIAPTGNQLVEQGLTLRPDLLIVDTALPELDGLAAADAVCRQTPVPVIAVFGRDDAEAMTRTLDNPYILACLLKPLNESELAMAVALAVRRFRQFQSCKQKMAVLREALEERKLIERAKGLVSQFCGLDEQAAHHRLQKLASVRNERLVEAARNLLAAGEVFQLLQQLTPAEPRHNGRAHRWPLRNVPVND